MGANLAKEWLEEKNWFDQKFEFGKRIIRIILRFKGEIKLGEGA